ncbi:putative trichodiene synthase [Aspergillus sclerotioniger CBS 115572]|uniref:Putative trichodiene synthase n=1 Tax=Aspergillus sclerotioniger CBS 115572 TaxID=1450535 RepID=A0A317X2E0_9EURO|nr:putative trichodiene synthase [Aspergillus sclerotioniger CBS 115572]PWY91667.1 putative trichodiene synthase [Aspergillus sclerotioniger CBS 115572]
MFYNILMTRVHEYFTAQDLPSKLTARLPPIIKWSTAIALTAYPHVSPGIQRVVAIFTVYLIAIDHLAGEILDDLKQVARVLFKGQASENPLRRSFVRFLDDSISNAYGQFATGMILKATLESIAACYVEVELEGAHALTLPPDARGFPYYLRLKTSIAEAYAFLAFPRDLYPDESHFRGYLLAIPELTYFFKAVNDIFSFYKESIVRDETGNFVCNVAVVNAVSPLRALEDICQKTIRVTQRVRCFLSMMPGMQRDIEHLVQGYIPYHLSQTRYRLVELDIHEAWEAGDLMKATLFEHRKSSQSGEQRAVGHGRECSGQPSVA